MLGPFVRSFELENVMQNLWIRIDLKRELEAFLEHIGLVVGAGDWQHRTGHLRFVTVSKTIRRWKSTALDRFPS